MNILNKLNESSKHHHGADAIVLQFCIDNGRTFDHVISNDKVKTGTQDCWQTLAVIPNYTTLVKHFTHTAFSKCSVQFSRSAVSDSLWPHEPQHARPPCPSPTPGVHPNPCALCQWCHPAISSSVVPFSSCPQSFPASGSFQMSQLFASGGQSIGVSASTSVLPMNT